MKQLTFLVLAFLALVPAGINAQQTTVILVRHAEKVDGPGDVILSETGRARAARLTDVLRNAGITAIYSTPYKRTLDTAAPLANALGLEVRQTPATSAYAQAMADRLFKEQLGKTVLVVGHSNTTPDLAKALGVTVPPIADAEYDNLYVVQIAADGKATVIRAKY